MNLPDDEEDLWEVREAIEVISILTALLCWTVAIGVALYYCWGSLVKERLWQLF